MSKFSARVIEVVDSVPYGKVVSYGQVALYVGVPRAARQVGWILRQSESKQIPWWRVINNAGRITIKGNRYNTPDLQRKLLMAEGVEVDDNYELDIERYRYKASKIQLKRYKLDEDYIDIVLHKLPPRE